MDVESGQLFGEIVQHEAYTLPARELRALELYSSRFLSSNTPFTLVELGSGSNMTKLQAITSGVNLSQVSIIATDIDKNSLDVIDSQSVPEAKSFQTIAGEMGEIPQRIAKPEEPIYHALFGSTFFGFSNSEMITFLSGKKEELRSQDRLIITGDAGPDDQSVDDIMAQYHPSFTADFKVIPTIRTINTILYGVLDTPLSPNDFEYLPEWDQEELSVMHYLVPNKDIQICVKGRCFCLWCEGEKILNGRSAKWSARRMTTLAKKLGLEIQSFEDKSECINLYSLSIPLKQQ